MAVIRFFSEPFWQQLGLTLMHFLWQGLLVALLVAAVVGVLRLRHGQGRYWAYLGAFAVMAICPLLTFLAIHRPSEIETLPLNGQMVVTPAVEAPSAAVRETGASSASTAHPETASPVKSSSTASRLHALLPWAVVLWMVGVAVLSLRLLLGYIGIRRWQRHLGPLPEAMTERVARVAERLGIPAFSRMFVCPALTEATVVGYLRPMILLPAAMLTRMDPAMLEAVIAHELAHIRRLDLWINLAQRIVETLLFYHPAVWWLSNRLRTEREYCCDEMAVAATGEPVAFASALETAQRQRLHTGQPDLAVALGQGKQPTLHRVRHILGLPPAHADSRSWIAGLVVVVILAILALPAVSVLTAEAGTDNATTDQDLTLRLIEAAETGDAATLRQLIARGADVNAGYGDLRWTPLHAAAERGQTEVVKLLIAHSADVKATAKYDWTPLFAAASRGRTQTVQLLLAHGAHVDDADTVGYTPLFYAIWADAEETVNALIAHGADVNKTRQDDYSALVYAIWQGHMPICKALIDAGADVNAKDRDAWTPLYWAVDEGKAEIVRLLANAGAEMSNIHGAIIAGELEQVRRVVQSGTAVDTRDRIGRPLSYWAVATGRTQILRYLLDQGADVGIVTQKGATLLHEASKNGLADAAELLIGKGAPVDAKTDEGATPLMWGAENGHGDVCRVLIAAGADVNAVCESGRHSLGDAAMGGHEHVVRILLAHGADANLSANNVGTALHAAAAYGHPSLVGLLIDAGADVNANRRNGTPLHLAANMRENGNSETVRKVIGTLLDEGAHVDARDETHGYTPLHVTARAGEYEAARLLLAAGADVNAIDKDGRTPLFYAEDRYNSRKVAKLLREHDATE